MGKYVGTTDENPLVLMLPNSDGKDLDKTPSRQARQHVVRFPQRHW
jgi:hypothetical protein